MDDGCDVNRVKLTSKPAQRWLRLSELLTDVAMRKKGVRPHTRIVQTRERNRSTTRKLRCQKAWISTHTLWHKPETDVTWNINIQTKYHFPGDPTTQSIDSLGPASFMLPHSYHSNPACSHMMFTVAITTVPGRNATPRASQRKKNYRLQPYVKESWSLSWRHQTIKP